MDKVISQRNKKHCHWIDSRFIKHALAEQLKCFLVIWKVTGLSQSWWIIKGFLNKMFFVVFYYQIEFKFVQFIIEDFYYKITKFFFSVIRLRYYFLFLHETTLLTECTVTRWGLNENYIRYKVYRFICFWIIDSSVRACLYTKVLLIAMSH